MTVERNLINLEDALIKIKTTNDLLKVLKDLCTPKELQNMQERWTVCQLLYQNLSYRAVHTTCGSSLTTITRVARFLTMEKNQGYKLLLQKVLGEKK